MKHKGSICDFVHERDNDILRAYREILRDINYIYMPDVYSMVADSPSSRFWVSSERACIVIANIANGGKLENMIESKREMFLEIYRRYLCEKTKHPELALSDIVKDIISQPAPKFYITPGTAKVIICRKKKELYKQKMKKLKHLFC